MVGFPFAAVVGADDVKLALTLAALDPGMGGVLLRGDKGSAKSTLARGMASLLPGDAPFVELPLGATEERVVGSIDLAAALTGGEVRFQPGLLAAAHGGVLYVDEVNLLADHLIDVLLDAAASGVNRVERDGISHAHPARFLLVGSMNPEEGDLRPQLLDRFGLAVDIRNPTDPAVRAEIVRRRRHFDADPSGFVSSWAPASAELSSRVASSSPAAISDALLVAGSAVCVAAGAESVRADLVLARAAAAHAGWDGRTEATEDDLRAVAHLALLHRQRRQPLDGGPGGGGGIDQALDSALSSGDPGDGAGAPDESVAAAAPPVGNVTPIALAKAAGGGGGRRSMVVGERGRTVAAQAFSGGSVAVLPSLQAAAARGSRAIAADDLRSPVRETKAGNLLVLAVDASGSMGADERMAAVKGALLGLLVDAYQRRDRVALVTFRGAGAEVVLRPTGSVEIARQRLEVLATGGETPLAAGIGAAAELAQAGLAGEHAPLLVVVTDGRATGADGAFASALTAAGAVKAKGIPCVVIGVDPPGSPLVLSREVAEAMGAHHVPLPDFTAGRLEAVLRSERRTR